MDPRIFGINAMLADMEPIMRRLVGEHVDLAYVQKAGLWPVQLPAGKLEEFLLANAVDACDAMQQGGTLRLATANLRAPEGLPTTDAVALSVSDTGRTVSDAMRAAVRGHGRREGLGIRLGFETAEVFGGRLDVNANKGGGITVQLILPRAHTDADDEPAGVRAEPATETILVVEDDQAMMSATSRVLTRLGYSVLTALSAEAALRQLETHEGDLHLLLTDIVLPGMDGLTLASEVRKRRPGIRLAYMSGYSEEALRMKGAVDPSVPLLEKPFTFEGLAAMVRKVLN